FHDRDRDGTGVFDEPGKTATTRIAAGSLCTVSGDGRFVAFVGPSPTGGGVYVHDRSSGTTTLISARPDGQPAHIYSSHLKMSIAPSGRYVVFRSLMPDLTPESAGYMLYAAPVPGAP